MELVKVALLVPTFAPFTFHWYTGAAPPLVGVAVKVTDVPGHIVVADAPTLTEGTGAGVTTIFTGVLVTTAGEAQVAFDVICTVTASPLFKVGLVKVALLVPTFAPFTFHWYTGAGPPLTGEAVKVTDVPGHIVVADGFTLTVGTTKSFTVMVI